MTAAPRPAAGPRSASGVRRAGDRFQDLIVWAAALEVIRPRSPYTQVDVEINGVGNVDDVVLRGAPGTGDLYTQVKWASNTADLLDEDFLCAAPTNGRSLLQKFHGSYLLLRDRGAAPTLRLVTNRALDRRHPLLGTVDGGTDLLVPHAADARPGTERWQCVQAWATHVGTSRDSLLEMLAHLEFHTGRTVSAERERARALMIAAGLDDSDSTLDQGLGIVASWVIGGRREVPADTVLRAVAGLRHTDPPAVLSIQAIDADPRASDATIALDWVSHFDSDRPARTEPRDPSGWRQMERDLDQAAAALERQGSHSTVVRGAMRQATLFRVGAAVPAVRQHTLRYTQGQQVWSTDEPKEPVEVLVRRTEIGLGVDLVVVVGITLDPTDDVVAYLRDAAVPASHLITVTPAAGADDQSVRSPGEAVAYAEKIRNLVRAELAAGAAAEHIHLFLAGPGGLALLLGHRWNRTRETVVYEHRGAGRGYIPTFTVGG